MATAGASASTEIDVAWAAVGCPPPGTPPPYDPKTFYQQEYIALRAEVLQHITDLRALERNVAVACAAIWAWTATHPDHGSILFVPVALVVLGMIRAWAYGYTFERIGQYIKVVEAALGSKKPGYLPGGKEHFDDDLDGLGAEQETSIKGQTLNLKRLYQRFKRSYMTHSSTVFWLALLLASGIAFRVIKDVSRTPTPVVTITFMPRN